MGHGEQTSWSGVDFLTQLSGMSSEASPPRALFLAHRVVASGRLWMTQGVNIRSIDLYKGNIVDCRGFESLLEGIVGERPWTLMEWTQAAVDGGVQADVALDQIGVSLCAAAVETEKSGDWMVNFVPSSAEPELMVTVPMGVSAALQAAIQESVSDEEVRSWLEGVAGKGLETMRPVDSPTERWGLSPDMYRLLDVAERVDSVGAFFVEIGGTGWSALGVLWKLGLIGGQAGIPELPEEPALYTDEVEFTEEEPDTSEVPKASPTRSTDTQPRRRSADRTERASASEKRGTKSGQKRKRRRRDPRLVAIMRAPYENPERMEAQLREAYDVLTRMRPEVIFRVKTSADLELANIERRHRDACSRYHPDRYRNASQGVQSLAEGCFAVTSDAFHTLKNETYQEELRVRLIEKETGKRVVTDKTRALAKVEYAKADVLFKQKRYDSAYDLACRASEGDPERWQYLYLQYRAAYRAGVTPLDEVRDAIGRLTGMNSMEKGNSLYIVGEMYMRDGNEEKAFELFRQALTLDDQNVGARRRLRLQGRRAQEATERESTGIFGGLFQRRKR